MRRHYFLEMNLQLDINTIYGHFHYSFKNATCRQNMFFQVYIIVKYILSYSHAVCLSQKIVWLTSPVMKQ